MMELSGMGWCGSGKIWCVGMLSVVSVLYMVLSLL